jgi:hypothetical protein
MILGFGALGKLGLVAGMVDRYAMRLFEKLFVPLPWPVNRQT